MMQTRYQIAALPFGFDAVGGIEVYLVTTRGSGRWIVPKRNPIRGMAPHAVAAQEALEEAGLVGQAEPRSVGTFLFDRIRDQREKACLIDCAGLAGLLKQHFHFADEAAFAG